MMSMEQFLEWDREAFSLWAMRATPHQRLLIAILVRSIIDYLQPWHDIEGEKKDESVSRASLVHHYDRNNDKRDAIRFFRHKGQEPFSFLWICQQIADDASGFRRGILEALDRLQAADIRQLKMHACHYRDNAIRGRKLSPNKCH